MLGLFVVIHMQMICRFHYYHTSNAGKSTCKWICFWIRQKLVPTLQNKTKILIIFNFGWNVCFHVLCTCFFIHRWRQNFPRRHNNEAKARSYSSVLLNLELYSSSLKAADSPVDNSMKTSWCFQRWWPPISQNKVVWDVLILAMALLPTTHSNKQLLVFWRQNLLLVLFFFQSQNFKCTS